jgi:arginine transport system substrate-binding protein
MFLLPNAHAESVLYVGIDPGTPPFVIQEGAGPVFSGLDVDLLSALCRRINRVCIFKPMSFSNFFTALDAGQIQLAIGAITITPEREQKFIFSLPYLADTVSFVTLANSTIKKVDDLRGKKIAIDKGSILRNYLQLYFYKDITIVEIDGLMNILEALRAGSVDAAFFDTVTIEFWKNNDMADLKLIGPKISIGLGYGIMGLPYMRPVMDQINAALESMENDGAYLSIYQQYLSD